MTAIGSVWASGSWADNTWAAGTWADVAIIKKSRMHALILEQEKDKRFQQYLENARMVEMKESELLKRKLAEQEQVNQALLKTTQIINRQAEERVSQERKRLDAIAGILEPTTVIKPGNPALLANRMIALEKANAAREEKKRKKEALDQQRLKNLQKARRTLKRNREK